MSFKVDVPIKKGNSESEKQSKDSNKLNKGMQSLTKQIAIGNAIANTLSSVTDGLSQLIAPLTRVLSALFVVIFLPLLPMLTKLTDSIAKFTVDVSDAGGGFKGLAEALRENFDARELIGLGSIIAGLILVAFTTGLSGIGWSAILLGAVVMQGDKIASAIIDTIGEFWSGVLASILIAAGAIILLAIGGWIVAIVGILTAGIVAFWEEIIGTFKSFGESIKTGWNEAIDGIRFVFFDMPTQLSELFVNFIKSMWNTLKSIPKMMVNIFKSLANGIIGSVNSLIPGKSFDIPYLADGGIVTKPTVAMIGEAGPEAVVPLNKMNSSNSITINVNNPTVRSDSDIKKLTDQVSRALQAKGNRRFS